MHPLHGGCGWLSRVLQLNILIAPLLKVPPVSDQSVTTPAGHSVRSQSDNENGAAARKAAELLFKRSANESNSHAIGITTSLPHRPAKRSPRILPAITTSPQSPGGEPEGLKHATPSRQRRTRKSADIPTSEYRRIRTLVEYGLTVDQASELYGVPQGKILSIIGPRQEV